MSDICLLIEFNNSLYFFVAVVLFIYHKKRTVRQSILFMGLSDSGKTLLFSQLLHSKFVSTYTSIKENQGQYAVNNVKQ